MLATEVKRFSQLLQDTFHYYGKSMDAALFNQYWEALKLFPWDEVALAFKRHAAHPTKGDFMPKISELMRWLSGHPENLALQAWTKVLKALQNPGCSRSVAFDDALIHVVIEQMSSWSLLGQMTTQEVPFRAQEFIKRYQYCVAEWPMNYPKYLIGNQEHYQRLYGMATEPDVLLIGDPTKAQAVIAQGGLPTPQVYSIQSASLKKLLQTPPKASHSLTTLGHSDE